MKRLKKSKKIVLALSGGLDSSVLLHMIANEGYDEIHTLTFDYGQRHKREIECAEWQVKNCQDRYGCVVTNKVIDCKYIRDIATTSSLTNDKINTPKISEIAGDAQPVSYVPFRNMMFLSICAAYAESLEAETIVYGVTQVDSLSGYFDCDKTFVDAVNKLIGLNRKHKIEVLVPMITMSKADIVKKGLDLGVNFSQTYTCYSGKEIADAETPASSMRIKGFIDNKLKDPQQYIQQEKLEKLYADKGCNDIPDQDKVEQAQLQTRHHLKQAKQKSLDPGDRDKRPQLGGWAPGVYMRICWTCGREFIGDKRASTCAPCAYYE